MGRDALSMAVSYLDLTANDTVVLPVYTCQDVLKFFVRKCHVLFYDVGHDLTIDPDEVRAKLKGRGRIRMVLITNYFGFLQPHRSEIKKLCAERDICLIEDCAHSLLTEGSGETGDLSTYSLRKILPLRDGGGLRINGNGKIPVPQYHHRLYSDTLSFLAFAKALLNIRTEKFSRARVASHTAQVLPLPSKDSRILPLSRFARHSMRNISFAEVAKRRRDDFQFWQEATRGNSSLIPMFGDLPPGVCPLGFAIRTKDRESLEARSREKGINLRVHWRLDGTLASECSTSHELSREMLTLPLYPELKPKDRELLAGLVTRRRH
jgi:dTDP-4-amino-4,6-dideoxygalactose transaminase